LPVPVVVGRVPRSWKHQGTAVGMVPPNWRHRGTEVPEKQTLLAMLAATLRKMPGAERKPGKPSFFLCYRRFFGPVNASSIPQAHDRIGTCPAQTHEQMLPAEMPVGTVPETQGIGEFRALAARIGLGMA
jgi:hypothetical protein